ncbi:MAG TPA: CBS domain-containing protein, partial [Cellvibrionaceae bacterium]
RRFLNRYSKLQAPVIAADHQLVGVVSSRDIELFIESDETRRAQAVNQRYRQATGATLDNADELTAWTRRAEHYCTVHQIMREPTAQVEAEQPLEKALTLLLAQSTPEVYVVSGAVLVGSVDAHQLLRYLFTPAS